VICKHVGGLVILAARGWVPEVAVFLHLALDIHQGEGLTLAQVAKICLSSARGDKLFLVLAESLLARGGQLVDNICCQADALLGSAILVRNTRRALHALPVETGRFLGIDSWT
jgi:hypothetical protein